MTIRLVGKLAERQQAALRRRLGNGHDPVAGSRILRHRIEQHRKSEQRAA